MSILFPLIFLLFITWGVYKWRFFNLQGISRRFLVLAFLLKITAGLLLTLLYTEYYTNRQEADTFRYFDDSSHLHRAATENPKAYARMLFGVDDGADLMPYLDSMNNWFPAERTTFYNDNRTVIRINALLRWVSFGNYYIHLFVFAFAAFYGITFIYKAFHRYFTGKKKWLAVILFLTPSLVFWSSGILKEGPLLFVFGITLNVLNKIFTKRAYRQHYLLLVGCALFLFHLKFYVGLMLIPATTGYLWILNKKGPHAIVKLIANYAAYFFAAVIWHRINWHWSLFTVLKWKRRDFIGLANEMNAKSFFHTGALEDNPISFLIHVPEGFFNAILRPFIWDVYSLVILPNAVENIIIVLFILFCIIYGSVKQFNKIGYFFIGYAFSLLTVIGMVTPIVGSLVRYKIPAIPFLLLFFLLFLNKNKIRFLKPYTNKISSFFVK